MGTPIHGDEREGRGLAYRFRRGVVGNGAATLFTQGSVLVGNIAVANLLGRETFGEFSLIYSTVVSVSGVAALGTGLTATKYAAEFRHADRALAERILGMCLGLALLSGAVGAAGLALGADAIASRLFGAERLAGDLALASAYVLFTVVNGFQVGALAGIEAYPSLARAGVVVAIVHVGLIAGAAWLGGLAGAAAALAASAAVRWWVFSLVLGRMLKRVGLAPTPRDLLASRAVLWRFTLPAALSGLTAMPALWVGSVVLAQQPQGYADLGLYGAANSIRAVVLVLPLLLNTVGTSLLNDRRGAHDQEGYRRVYWLNLGTTLVLAGVGATLTASVGALLLGVFGPTFADGAGVLHVLLVSTVVEALAVAAYQSVQSRERMWLSLFAVSFPRDAVFVALAFGLVPGAGASGLATAYLLSWTLALLVILTIVWRVGLATHGPA